MKFYKIRHKASGKFFSNFYTNTKNGKSWSTLNFARQAILFHELKNGSYEIVEFTCDEGQVIPWPKA